MRRACTRSTSLQKLPGKLRKLQQRRPDGRERIGERPHGGGGAGGGQKDRESSLLSQSLSVKVFFDRGSASKRRAKRSAPPFSTSHFLSRSLWLSLCLFRSHSHSLAHFEGSPFFLLLLSSCPFFPPDSSGEEVERKEQERRRNAVKERRGGEEEQNQ